MTKAKSELANIKMKNSKFPPVLEKDFSNFKAVFEKTFTSGLAGAIKEIRNAGNSFAHDYRGRLPSSLSNALGNLFSDVSVIYDSNSKKLELFINFEFVSQVSNLDCLELANSLTKLNSTHEQIFQLTVRLGYNSRRIPTDLDRSTLASIPNHNGLMFILAFEISNNKSLGTLLQNYQETILAEVQKERDRSLEVAKKIDLYLSTDPKLQEALKRTEATKESIRAQYEKLLEMTKENIQLILETANKLNKEGVTNSKALKATLTTLKTLAVLHVESPKSAKAADTLLENDLEELKALMNLPKAIALPGSYRSSEIKMPPSAITIVKTTKSQDVKSVMDEYWERERATRITRRPSPTTFNISAETTQINPVFITADHATGVAREYIDDLTRHDFPFDADARSL